MCDQGGRVPRDKRACRGTHCSPQMQWVNSSGRGGEMNTSFVVSRHGKGGRRMFQLLKIAGRLRDAVILMVVIMLVGCG